MTVPDLSGQVTSLLGYLAAADRQGAIEHIERLYLDGAPVPVIVTDVLAAAQREIGRRWLANQWTVSQEHQATAIVDAALAAVTVLRTPEPAGPPVVVACAEGEWHALAARMFAELLRLRGFPVIFTGASTPVGTVAGLAEGARAVACSCSVAAHLPAVLDLIVQVRPVGVPVLVGGAALDAGRARALGADGWAQGAGDAAGLLHTWAEAASPAPAVPEPPDAFFEWGDRRAAVAAAMAAGDPERRWPWVGDLLAHIGSALLVGDPAVAGDYLAWLGQYTAARGIPRRHLWEGIAAVHAALSEAASPAGALLGSLLEETGDGGRSPQQGATPA